MEKRILASCCVLLVASVSWAEAPRPAELLPSTTRGYVHVPDRSGLEDRWQDTQLAQLLEHPQLQPLLENLRGLVQSDLSQLSGTLGVDFGWTAFLDSQTLTLAIAQPAGPQSVALAMIADVRISDADLEQTLNLVERRLQPRIAGRQSDGALTIYRLQDDKTIVHAVTGGMFVASTHAGLARDIVARIEGTTTESSLADVAAFQSVLERTELPETAADVVWFIEPSGYIQALRATQGEVRPNKVLRALTNQGFDTFTGLGGQIAFRQGEADMVHRSFVQHSGQLARGARILSFPNASDLTPPAWVPADVNYLALQWDIQQAFGAVGSLIDEIADEAVFEEILEEIRTSRAGMQLDIRNDVVAHLGQRVTVITDCVQPITPHSQRAVVAIELRNPAAVADALNQSIVRNPVAVQRRLGNDVVWEMTTMEEDELTLTVEFGDDGLGFDEFNFDEPAEEAPQAPSSMVGVIGDRLVFASDIELAERIFTAPAGQSLHSDLDYQRVSAVMNGLSGEQQCFQMFRRLEQALHAPYELLRTGQLSEITSLVRQAVDNNARNTYFGSQEGLLEQLPPFESIRPYLGLAGMSVETQADGWLISGCTLPQ